MRIFEFWKFFEEQCIQMRQLYMNAAQCVIKILTVKVGFIHLHSEQNNPKYNIVVYKNIQISNLLGNKEL
jgi:hypothetical protein